MVEKKVDNDNNVCRRLPGTHYLLSLPLTAFIRKNNDGNERLKSIEQNMNRLSLDERHKWLLGKTNTVSCSHQPTSVIISDTVYGKDYWLKKQATTSSQPAATETETAIAIATNNDSSMSINLEEHIQKCNQKMKDLHKEYLATIEKCSAELPHTKILVDNPILKRPQSDFLAKSPHTIQTVTKLSNTLNNYSKIFDTMLTIKNMPFDQFIAKK